MTTERDNLPRPNVALVATYRRHEGVVQLRIDDHSIEVPSPHRLARDLLAPALAQAQGRRVYRRGSALVLAPEIRTGTPPPIDDGVIRSTLLDVLRRLPDLPNALDHYKDLRFLALHGNALLDDYLDKCVTATRRALPCFKPPKAEADRPRPRPRTPKERAAASRTRKREAQEEWARWMLITWAGEDADEDDRLTPAEILADILASDIGEDFESAQMEWEEDARVVFSGNYYRSSQDVRNERAAGQAHWLEYVRKDDMPEAEPVMPGPRIFARVCAALLESKYDSSGTRRYLPMFRLAFDDLDDKEPEGPLKDELVTDEPEHGTQPSKEITMSSNGFNEEILDRIARLVWEERHAELDAYVENLAREHRPDLGATGTDDETVINLAERRAAR